MCSIAAAFYLIAGICLAQETSLRQLESLLNFEAGPEGKSLLRWGGGPVGAVSNNDKVVRSGKWAARVEAVGDFSTITMNIPVSFSGNNIGCEVF